MPEWDQRVIEEFRANGGLVGGPFEGFPMILVHHVGRKSGKDYVTPLVYLPSDAGDGEMYLFASVGGAPEHPDWYRNLITAGQAIVEVGDSTLRVAVSEVTGDERDRLYAEQVRRIPVFAEYEQKARGIRTIPVVLLTPA